MLMITVLKREITLIIIVIIIIVIIIKLKVCYVPYYLVSDAKKHYVTSRVCQNIVMIFQGLLCV